MAGLVWALPAGSYLVLAHPASDIRAARMAELTRRVNERIRGPKATIRDRVAIARFFDGWTCSSRAWSSRGSGGPSPARSAHPR